MFFKLLGVIGDFPNNSIFEKLGSSQIEEEELRTQLEFLKDEEVVNGLKMLGSLV